MGLRIRNALQTSHPEMRALRKLQKEKELKELEINQNQDVESGTDDEPVVEKKLNLFDCLDGGSDGLPDNDSDKDNDKDNDSSVPQVESAKKSKVITKKPKKNKIQQKPYVQDEDDLDIEKYAKELDEKLGITYDVTSQPTTSQPSLFAITTKNLDAELELKRIFGSHVVTAETRKRNVRIRKKYILATPLDTWPSTVQCGLGMQYNGKDDMTNTHAFTFTHTKQYNDIQYKLLDALQTHDPNQISHLSRVYPGCVDALLILSNIHKQNGDVHLASETCQRLLHVFETSFHPLFNPTTHTCQLSYTRVENRCFFVVVYMHVLYVERKGCWGTAFEWCKLLYGLSKEDPLFVLACIDFYALKAGAHLWVIRAYKALQEEVKRLPNWMFGVALAHFWKEVEEGQEHTVSTNRLQIAIAHFPKVVVGLVEKCALDVNVASFQKEKYSSQLDLLVELYIEKCHPLFKDIDIVPWFKSGVESYVRLARSSTSPFSKVIDEGKLKREREYTSAIPLKMLRHVFVSEYGSLNSYIPREFSSQSMHDPFPPVLETPNIYEQYALNRNTTHNPFSEMSILDAFTTSLLPWLNIEPQQDGQHQQQPRPAPMNEEMFRGLFENAVARTPDVLRGGVDVMAGVMNRMRQVLIDVGAYQANVPVDLGIDEQGQEREEADE